MATQSRKDRLSELNKRRKNEQQAAKASSTIVDEVLDNYNKATSTTKKADSTKKESSKTKSVTAKKPAKEAAVVEKAVEEVAAPVEASIVAPEPEAVPEITEPEVAAPVTEPFINEPVEVSAPTPDQDILKLLAQQYGLINVMDKSRVGRPKREGYYHKISLNLKAENLMYAKSVGGKYGGVTGYINYLIEQDMKKNQ